MKKSRFMVLALVVAVMLMGAGYAYWTDSVTITNTVTTGNLEFNLTDLPTELVLPDYVTGDVVYAAVADKNKAATVTIDNMYPGAVATVDLAIDNVSTIPTKLSNLALNPVTGDWSQYTITGTVTIGSAVYPLSTDFSTVSIGAGEDIAIHYVLTAGDVDENATCSATIAPIFHQFNE